MNSVFICPVCKIKFHEDNLLLCNEKSYFCTRKHSFDRSAHGYVNLENAKNAHSENSGDSKAMCEARSAFLSKGFYTPLADAIADLLLPFAEVGGLVADAGCGEGHYLRRLRDRGYPADALSGIDLARPAVNSAAKCEKEKREKISYAAASIFEMPYGDAHLSAVLSVFAPVSDKEAARSLRQGGLLLVVSPGEGHLWELKSALYDIPHPNEEKTPDYDGFLLIETKRVTFPMLLSGEDMKNLFQMTPYSWKSPKESASKLEQLPPRTIKAEFLITIYKKA